MSETTTQKPMGGTWRLTSPDGRHWEGTGPLAACRAEQVERVPPSLQLERVLADEQEVADWMMEKDAARYRWLRGRLPGSAYRIEGVIYSEGGSGVDSAIDAAMAAELAIGAATQNV